ncbi:MAG: YncE family protein, partial [Pyrinomonadaceae bacterium]|nr:YncE family protein [Pyrinomonadaceae bacterium]
MRILLSTVLSVFLSTIVLFTFTCAQEKKSESDKLVLVLNKNEASMTVFDADSMKTVGSVGVGDGPHEVVVSKDGTTAFVANYGGRTPGSSISVIDLKSIKELRRVDLSPLIRPHGIQEINGKIYFSAEASRAIARYDPATNKVDWIMGTGQDASHMVVGSADERRFYTSNIASNSVTMFELQSAPPARSRITQIPVGNQPEAIDLSPDGKEVWVGLNSEGAIDVIDTAAKKVVEKLDLGARPYRVKFTPDGKHVFATLLGKKEIVVIDAATRKETKRIPMKSVAWG